MDIYLTNSPALTPWHESARYHSNTVLLHEARKFYYQRIEVPRPVRILLWISESRRLAYRLTSTLNAINA